jgi:hypothetical protein
MLAGCRNLGCHYAPVREMRIPSFCIRDWSVDRFMPKSAAAPLGPATIQLACSSAAKTC